MYPISTRIRHSGHGLGTVINHRTGSRTNPQTVLEYVQNSSIPASILPAAIESFYPPNHYPNIVQFDDTGYLNFYADSEIEVI